ncbi:MULTISPECIES: TetR/AcrR family transcriptional regulator [unclassified Pseudomonas]|uniref:TetR/AcrR family transcriptional regulator n=1 Tax=unclassified Pseudomonas TaxID=196821 RepID=UPI00119A5CFA|nr:MULTISPECIES: TetR/AcrR family transcriptional regulator [unclassified Pseudomonas]TWC15479.1 TetR family transcriptional regulator [Pseudomonas sp. SJZ075]TWC19101.1 TetR family transcriptional regulator [Pseudomonas sp. SJZ074]TWC30433.1 TetR family transcriptional regulator [Pseudomonas sp. SJZ078]TWC36883.1 TetR family transcriptional regulator [Pseudomonas sp. SJZ085]TWC53166.1 TetR family transcriptional regulator [Pseudomonas sp. SJZ124]
MQTDIESPTPSSSRRLSKAERRRQLLDTALLIVREEGADRLTLGHLAVRAGVSKPVVYDHFGTRSDLLIELYKWIDTERVNAFRDAMTGTERPLEETALVLASAYIQCAADNTDEFFAVGAALAGSNEKAVVFQELLDNCVQMFTRVLKPHTELPVTELERRCTGLVGAGEALAGASMRGRHGKDEVTQAFAALIRGAVQDAD